MQRAPQFLPMLHQDHLIDWEAIHLILRSYELAYLKNNKSELKPIEVQGSSKDWFDFLLPVPKQWDYDEKVFLEKADQLAFDKLREYAKALFYGKASVVEIKQELSDYGRKTVKEDRGFKLKVQTASQTSMHEIENKVQLASELHDITKKVRDGSVIILGVASGIGVAGAFAGGVTAAAVGKAAAFSATANLFKGAAELQDISLEKGGIFKKENRGKVIATVLDVTMSIGVDMIPLPTKGPGAVGSAIFTTTMDFTKDTAVAALSGKSVPDAMIESGAASLIKIGLDTKSAKKLLKNFTLFQLTGKVQEAGNLVLSRSFRDKHRFNEQMVDVRFMGKIADKTMSKIFVDHAKKVTTNSGRKELKNVFEETAGLIFVDKKQTKPVLLSGSAKRPRFTNAVMLRNETLINRAFQYNKAASDQLINGTWIA